MDDDISKKTVAVLLLLAIILSITGTWLALTMEPAVVKHGATEDSASREMRFGILGQPAKQQTTPSVQEGIAQFNKLN